MMAAAVCWTLPTFDGEAVDIDALVPGGDGGGD
jgi:hypothetical protein